MGSEQKKRFEKGGALLMVEISLEYIENGEEIKIPLWSEIMIFQGAKRTYKKKIESPQNRYVSAFRYISGGGGGGGRRTLNKIFWVPKNRNDSASR